jgi:hypothetical protein
MKEPFKKWKHFFGEKSDITKENQARTHIEENMLEHNFEASRRVSKASEKYKRVIGMRRPTKNDGRRREQQKNVSLEPTANGGQFYQYIDVSELQPVFP